MRAAQTCLEMGGIPTVFAIHDTGLAYKEVVGGVNVRRFRIVSRPLPRYPYSQLLKCIEYFVRVVFAAIRIRPEIIYANDPLTLLSGFFVARLTRCRLIYDSHELYSGLELENLFSNWAFRFSLLLERTLVKKAESVITVSEAISVEMAKSMGINQPSVVRNIPQKREVAAHNSKSGVLRNALGITPETQVILYQGGIDTGRGLATMVEALTLLKHKQAVVVFLGNGSLVAELKSLVKTYGLEKRVYFHQAATPDDLPYWTEDADIGVHPIEGSCKNHRLCLPNKLFEYIQAGLPVVVTDLPEMRKIVNDFGVGEVFADGDARDLAARIDYVLTNGQRYRSNIGAAARDLDWDIEKQHLVEVYKKVLNL